MVTVLFCVGLLLAFVLSCSGGSGGGGGGDDDDQSLTVTGKSGNPVNLDGTWESECVADIADGESEMWVMTISGSTFSRNDSNWFDSTDCSGAFDVTVTISGTVVLGDELTVSMNGSNVTATENDITLSSYEC